MMTTNTFKRALRSYGPALGTALLLAACGGGGGDATPALSGSPSAVPDSASRSVAGMVDYMQSLAQSPSDTGDPLDVSAYAPPRPDDTEPTALR